MSFWGGGSKKDSSASSSKDFTDTSTPSFPDESPSYPPAGGASAASAATDMQQFSLTLQQQMMVHTIITNLCDEAFSACITGKPSGATLNGKEAACIHATVNKFMDTNEFMIGRLAKKQKAAAAGGAF